MNSKDTEQLSLFQPVSPFDHIRQLDENGNEFWFARELRPILGYSKWDVFEKVVERAIISCENTNEEAIHHFSPSKNVVERAQGGGSASADFKLSRYGSYLIAMNGDPRKPEIALAQRYFAVKTQEAEQASSLEKVLADNVIRLSELYEQNRSIIHGLSQRLAFFEEERDKAEADLRSLPAPSVEAAPVSLRMQISRLVRDAVIAKGIAYEVAWRSIYRDFRDRYHVDLKARSKNTQRPGTKTPSKKPLDICEELEMLEQLYAVATDVLNAIPTQEPLVRAS